MSLKITHKYSTAAGTPPASGDIDVGEIAINAADAELYTKDSVGNIRKFQNTTTGTADGVQFTQSGTGAVQRTVESKLKDVVSVKDFGAVGDGVTDDTAAIQVAVNAVYGPGSSSTNSVTLLFSAGEYLVSDEIDLTNASKPIHIAGEGPRKTTFKVADFGANKKLFKGNSSGSPSYTYLGGFSITSAGGQRLKNHPVAIYFPNTSRLTLRDISTSAYGNSAIVAGPAFNSQWENLDLFSTGYQPLYKTNTVTVSTTSGSADITAASAIFDAADVGKTVFIEQAPSGGSPSNSAIAATISAFTSSTEVTLSAPCFYTGSGLRLSWDAVSGSITSGSSSLTLDTACLDQDDVGRIITVLNAGDTTGEHLIATISAVINSTQCTLSESAGATVTNASVLFSPTIYVGAEVSAPGLTPINDLVLTNVLIEQYLGPALVLDRGTNVHLSLCKFHGRAWSNLSNFATSRQGILVNNTSRVTLDQIQIEFGCAGTNNGMIQLGGGNVSVALSQAVIGATCHNSYIFSFVSSGETSFFHLESVNARTADWSKMAGYIYRGGTFGSRNVISGPYVSSTSIAAARSISAPPVHGGQFRSSTPVSVDDDNAISVIPDRNQGFVLLSTDATTCNGIYWYRVDSGPNLQLIYAGTDLNNTTGPLSGTTGSDGKMTISAANDGKIYIENRFGTTRLATLTFLGG